RLREATAAEKSFQEAQRVSPQNVEALNGLGMVQLQRARASEAARYFAAALKKQSDYRPALLNLAMVLHQNLNDRPGALQKYREYLALKPRESDWEDVNAIAQSLEQQLTPAPPTNVLVRAPQNTNSVKPTTSTVARVTAPPPKAEQTP